MAPSREKKPPALKLLMVQLKNTQTSMDDIWRFVEGYERTTTASQVNVRLLSVDELWQKYGEILADIQAHDDFEDENEAFDKARLVYSDRYYYCKAFLMDKAKEMQDPGKPIVPYELTRRQRMEFNGDIDEWISFRDLFTSLIHRKIDLPEVEKFHYLKGCLQGEPKSLIDSLKITKANYQIAWDLLLKRYDNSKLLKKRQVQALFNLPTLSKESVADLHTLIDGFEKVVQNLDQVVQPEDYKDLLLVNLLTSRLDPTTRRGWEEHSSAKDQDTLADLSDFLHRRIRILESLPVKALDSRTSLHAPQSSRQKASAVKASYGSIQSSGGRCVACKENHPLYQCSSFLRMSVRERDAVLRTNSLCRNCFRSGHIATDCTSKYRCRNCNGRHHTMVCFKQRKDRSPKIVAAAGNNNPPRMEPGDAPVPSSSQVVNMAATDATVSGSTHQFSSKVLLATAVVIVEDDEGSQFPARALLDSGSESNFIAERLSQRLRSHREKVEISVLGIGHAATRVKHQITALVRSRATAYSRNMNFLVLPKVTVDLPTARWTWYGDQLPTLNDSVFGWVVCGGLLNPTQGLRINCSTATTKVLEELVARFWASEEVGNSKVLSSEEKLCEDNFRNSVRRKSDGQYSISLPKDKDAVSRLGESRDIAFRRLQSTERRLAKDASLREQYHQFMAEYIQLGHMSKVEEAGNLVKRCYLPHHPVFKEASTTTKVRVVFDASCKTSSGVSLNDTLLVGPIVQEDLRSIMLRSRVRQIMLVADVEKMFRQVFLVEVDRSLQCILWRFDPTDPVGVYELNTVTYGTKPAPFLATRTLNQLAMDEGGRYPMAARATTEDTYMDDVITSADTEDAAQNLAICVAEGIDLDPDPAVKTLGLTWLPISDQLRFQFSIPTWNSVTQPTKRQVLSVIASLFDPLGLLGAAITTGKIIMQLLWKIRNEDQALGWDKPLPSTVGEMWRKYHEELPLLNNIRIDRCVMVPRATLIELHCFSDASTKAFGGCVYIRSHDSEGRVVVRLLSSKSKVAPLKTQSIPRLELCGALLVTQLYEKVRDSIRTPAQPFFWVDSTCVLRWIQASPNNWTTFVANRVAKIQSIAESSSWRHVSGKENPADLISRGISPKDILDNAFWWEGPDWLKEPSDHWPAASCSSSSEEAEKERRRAAVCAVSANADFNDWYLEKFASYSDLIRRTAIWLRLMKLLKNNSQNRTPAEFLSAQELREAEFVIVRRIQQEVFADEWKALSRGNTVSRKSPLRWFNPRISEDQVIRIGGRLSNSAEREATKHPMVLPARHKLTRMILKHYHLQLLHAGPQLLLGVVRLRFWPLGGRSVARNIVHQCLKCFRAKPTPIQQFMGELPVPRVTVSRPFSQTGVDYFGPFYVRPAPRRPVVKVYVAVFICLCTKAVHLELVSDLSTDRFLQALHRFISRRGRCRDIYSDNGTNFVGARNLMKDFLKLLQNSDHRDKVSKECAEEGIHWHFSPPSAPHFGGLWEAAVRSAKNHLIKVIGETLMSPEDFNTLLVQIEGCLNSRPLTPMSDDPCDLEPLTPGHFLVGSSIQSLPEPNLEAVPLNRLSQYQLIQRMLQDFWKRWRREYLCQLQGRSKRWKPAVKIEVGKLVVIRDDNLPPMKWKMARILQLHPGNDGVVRVVTLKTSTGLMKRAVEKLCLLPTPIEDRQHQA
ncbi:uncharacterized protein LOC134207198 [Armigeres subalbatus]|uniref:uncharacterized protein LOC134207198 n=1 Tax=Armigeres subalbatus TaxID=124917 RepID=UPI002ED5EB1C